MTFNEKYKDNVILIKSFEFAIKIVEYSEELESFRKYVLANQLLKSGTSIGANIKEAQNAESKKDFIHKMKIAIKEADETEYWLFICDAIKNYPECKSLLFELESIIKILNKIISSSVKSLNK
ncbi:four helix bundle protein [Aquimarina sp. BL5]|uniref:four helix bundle protein n=1 Tax=Aquimarina sp. BL5 TaxID=1714860 RepID=UPI000E5260D8|nr:four helix bundle protein [Aquimarina sp. BL5]AXT52174.1 four helix bundle protein [Aquimarina sp. BL5]RKN07714.1 four helix bundle protein [Aquimarina sp. BL5]